MSANYPYGLKMIAYGSQYLFQLKKADVVIDPNPGSMLKIH